MVMLSTFHTEHKTLSDYIDMFFEQNKRNSEDTHGTYYYALQKMSEKIFGVGVYELKKEDLESLKWDVLESYKSLLMIEGNANTTINSRISAIKSFIKFLTARKVISYDIAELTLIETLNDDGENIEMIPLETLMQYVEYFENFERRKGNEKKWVSLLALETGNRIQDLLSIKKNQFIKDGDDYILRSKGKNRGKGNKEYIERIGAVLYEELMKLNPDSENVFSIKYNAILDAFNRANEHFGNKIIRYTPHSVKHLSVTLEYRYTGDILCAQEKGKHSSIETTRRYLKIENTSRIGAYSRMLSTKTDKYKEANLDELINVISDLPMDIQYLINKKIEDLSNTKDNLS